MAGRIQGIRWYRVRKSWADAKSQKGAYKILDNAKRCAEQNSGYKVFDADGKVVYEPKEAEPAVKVPFLVKVSISDLNIRKGPGIGYDRIQFCPPGVYTIVEVKSGKGASAWGKLKSGIKPAMICLGDRRCRLFLFVIRDVLFMFKSPDHYGIENRKKVASHV